MEIKKELLYDGIYYDVTNWIKRHPGGTVIELYTKSGEDSSLAVQQFHQRSTKKVMSIMKSLSQRKYTDDENNYAKLDAGKMKHESLTKDFVELYETLLSEGLFKTNLFHVFFRLCEIFMLSVLGIFIIQTQLSVNSVIISGLGTLVLSVGIGRSAWVMHEAAHCSLTGNPKWDRHIKSFLLGIFLGGSGSQWSSTHSKHHAMPQHVKYDTDIKTLPLVAFHKDTVKNPKHGKGFLVQQQHWLFFPFGSLLIALLWKLYLHPAYCYRKKIYSDLFYMAIHYAIFFNYISFLNYWLVIWLVHAYLVLNFTLSHSHLPVTDKPTHWVEYSLTHTANIRSSTFGWVDYWMGNLNYQIEHHLFPTMPQYKNKLCRDRVKALAKKHNLPYNLYSYDEAVMKSLGNLGMVANELAVS